LCGLGECEFGSQDTEGDQVSPHGPPILNSGGRFGKRSPVELRDQTRLQRRYGCPCNRHRLGRNVVFAECFAVGPS
jgi:hypothetical protein